MSVRRRGEVVVTVIAGEDKESQSPPAEAGDIVVRNGCPATGKGEILVPAARFRSATGADRTGRCRVADISLRGVEMRHFVVRGSDGRFSSTAPWGEPMVARPGDAVVRDPRDDPADTYRIAAAGFACTCEILRPGPEP
jgi:hypothetical protein